MSKKITKIDEKISKSLMPGYAKYKLLIEQTPDHQSPNKYVLFEEGKELNSGSSNNDSGSGSDSSVTNSFYVKTDVHTEIYNPNSSEGEYYLLKNGNAGDIVYEITAPDNFTWKYTLPEWMYVNQYPYTGKSELTGSIVYPPGLAINIEANNTGEARYGEINFYNASTNELLKNIKFKQPSS